MPLIRDSTGWICEARMSLRRPASTDGLSDDSATNIRMSGLALATMTPCCVTCGGQQGLRQGDLVLHLDLGDILVGAGRKAQCDGRGAITVGGRGEIQQIIDAGELLLDDLRDRRFHGGGIGAGVGRH